MRVGYAVAVGTYRRMGYTVATHGVAAIPETVVTAWIWSDELVYRATL